MESIQPVRPPMSQQPPQRIDSDATSSSQQQSIERKDNNNKKDVNIPDVDISLAYKRRSLKHRVECGHRVKIGHEEISELQLILGPRKCQMYKKDAISACVVCDEQCIDGEFAVETVLFIPNKNDPAYDNLGRFRTELPRIVCCECAAEYASMNNVNPNAVNTSQLSLAKVWQNYQNGQLNNKLNMNNHTKSNQSTTASVLSNVAGLPSTVAPGDDHDDNKQQQLSQSQPPQQQQQAQSEQPQPLQPISQQQGQQGQEADAGNNNGNKATMPLSEAERDPFDDGFLICTQLVKTGGADQGGLQVGDVFVEFGHYSGKRFPGLKSIANLVRRSAGKEINVVVWRKLEQMNAVEDDGTGRTVFQKLALKLKPLQSHDADGGGVLGAVINTYPLPEMKN